MYRIKQFWEVLPLPEKIKLVWSRFTSSRLTIFYLILAVAHCLIQVGFQMTAHMANTKASELLEELVIHGGLQSKNFTLYDSDNKTLRSCWGVPNGEVEKQKCVQIWPLDASAAQLPLRLPEGYFQTPSTDDPQPVVATPGPSPTVVFFSLTSSAAPTSTAVPASNIAIPDDDESDAGSDVGDDNGVLGEAATTAGSSGEADSAAVVAPASLITGVGGLSKRTTTISPILGPPTANSSQPPIVGLTVNGIGNTDETVFINLECVQVLRWPVQTLEYTQREDIVFFLFQFWVLGMSMVALLNESIPHTVAALLTHLMATMWSGYQLASTQEFRKNFIDLTVGGACSGVNLLPTYWRDRGVSEISMLVLNCVALVGSALLSWKIVKAFGWATYRRIGADRKINRIYHVVLLMTIFLQLSVFFIVTSIALWFDQLCHGPIGMFTDNMMVYRAIMVAIIILLVPWLALGWFAVRKENKRMMYAFLGISSVILAQWSSTFLCDTWRLTFSTWDFFAIMSIVAAVLTLSVTVLGVLCFRNFGEGLSGYLKPIDDFNAKDFQPITPGPADEEKISWDSTTSFYREEKIAFPEMTAAPVYRPQVTFAAPVQDPEPTRVSLKGIAPSAMVTGPRPVGRVTPPAPVATFTRTRSLTRSNSASSASTSASERDPFYLAEKLSEAGSTSDPQQFQSRWSKDSSDKSKSAKSTKSTKSIKSSKSLKRWVIE